MKKHSGFTLIELLAVIAIIAILAALTLRIVGSVQDNSARARAEAEIKALSLALEDYKRDNGDYPVGANTVTTSSGNNQILFTNLSPTSGKVYFAFSKNMTNAGGYADPWGNSYGYQYPGDQNRSGTNFFDLWSTANKSTVTNAWIKNW